MSHNLSLLDPKTKNQIELDKQASFIVWKVKNGKGTFEDAQTQLDKIRDPDEREAFQSAIGKYRQMMSV